jgi:hypothetical protein
MMYDRFKLIGPHDTLPELILQLNAMKEDLARLVQVVTSYDGFYAVVDMNIQVIMSIDNNIEGSNDFERSLAVNMA